MYQRTCNRCLWATPGLCLILPATAISHGRQSTEWPGFARAAPPGILESTPIPDQNGDGVQELLAFADDGKTIRLSFSNGSGWEQPLLTTLSQELVYPVLGDIDADGRTDILGLLGGSDAVILFGTESGAFGEPVPTKIPHSFWPAQLIDLNGDAFADYLWSFGDNPPSYVYFGNGDGTVQNEIVSDDAFFNQLSGWADLNGDGLLDVVTPSDFFSGVFYSFGLSDGTFTDRIAVELPAGFFPFTSRVYVADIDGLNGPDIACLDREFSHAIGIAFQSADGTFAVDQTHAYGPALQLCPPTDLDGDGLPETLFEGAETGDLWRVPLLPEGTLGKPELVARDASLDRLEDVNLDGRADLVFKTGEVLLRRADGSFDDHLRVSGAGLERRIASGDFNADGLDDLVLASGDTGFQIRMGTGSGEFAPGLLTDVNGLVGTTAAPGDFNGDGRLDILIPNITAGEVQFFQGDGAGGFVHVSELTTPLAESGEIGVGDFNTDGNLDFCVYNWSFFDQYLSIWLGDGSGVFQRSFDSGSCEDLAIADINADGARDVLCASLSPAFHILPGLGDGTFGVGSSVITPAVVVAIQAIDIDHDGTTDIVAGLDPEILGFPAQIDSPGISVYRGLGDGKLAPQIFIGLDLPLQELRVADLNADGVPDLIAEHAPSDSISILMGVQGEPPEVTGRFHLGNNPDDPLDADPVVSDVDNDGDLDLLFVSDSQDEIILLVNPLVEACAADLSKPLGVLDFEDVLAFLEAFLTGDPAADLSPPFGVLDIRDALNFIELFMGGCS